MKDNFAFNLLCNLAAAKFFNANQTGSLWALQLTQHGKSGMLFATLKAAYITPFCPVRLPPGGLFSERACWLMAKVCFHHIRTAMIKITAVPASNIQMKTKTKLTLMYRNFVTRKHAVITNSSVVELRDQCDKNLENPA